MDVVASHLNTAPSFDNVFKNTVLQTDLIGVEVTQETREDPKTALVTETEVLQAVEQDPAVLEAQVSMEAINPLPVGDSSPTSAGLPPTADSFARMAEYQQQALTSLTPQQLALFFRYVSTLRRQRAALQRTLECAFCKKNGESLAWYTQHPLKDWRGRVLCPVLRAFHCPRCGATGDHAHTIKYCPENCDADHWSPGYWNRTDF